MTLDDAFRQLVREELAALLAAQPSPAPAAPDDDEVLDADGLMAYLHIGRNKAYGLLNTAPFPVRRVGALLLVHKSAVRRWLLAQDEPVPLRLTTPSSAPSRLARAGQPQAQGQG